MENNNITNNTSEINRENLSDKNESIPTKWVSDRITELGGIDNIFNNNNARIVCIEAGTGSGKSTWVTESLALTNKILMITSRRAKVNQDRNSINSGGLDDDDFGFYLCTNHKLKNIVRDITDIDKEFKRLDDPELFEMTQEELYYTKDFIEKYKYIVVDEIHSLAIDATYQSDVFIIQAFIRYVLQNTKVRIIFMTATTQPIQQFLSGVFDNCKEKYNVHNLDLISECRHSFPKKIKCLSRDDAMKKITELIENGDTFAYFFKNIGEEYERKKKKLPINITTFYKMLIDDFKIDKKKIAVIMSASKQEQWDKRNGFAKKYSFPTQENSNNDIEKMTYNVYIRKRIENEAEIPDEIQILLCTDTLTEGISIKNGDNPDNPKIKYAFTDHQYISYLIQQMGRFRNGLKCFYLMANPISSTNNIDENEMDFLNPKERFNNEQLEQLLPILNNNLSRLNEKDRQSQINYICKKFRYIEYNIFTNKLEIFYTRYYMDKILLEDNENAKVEIFKNEFYTLKKEALRKHVWNFFQYMRKFKCEVEFEGAAKERKIHVQEEKQIKDNLIAYLENAYISKKEFSSSELAKIKEMSDKIRCGKQPKKMNIMWKQNGIYYCLTQHFHHNKKTAYCVEKIK